MSLYLLSLYDNCYLSHGLSSHHTNYITTKLHLRPHVQPTQSKDHPYLVYGYVCSTASYNNDMWFFKGKGITANSD